MTVLLEQVIALTRRSDRAAAAAALADTLGAHSLTIFIRDPDVDALLPAPGFPQTLREAGQWRRLLDRCVSDGEARMPLLPPPEGGAPQPAHGYSCGPDAVMVLLGTTSSPNRVAEMRALLPLLAAALSAERAVEHASTRIRLAEKNARHAESLAIALDGVRAQLQAALADAAETRRQLELRNSQLENQTFELEEQKQELEMQREDLQQLNEELELSQQVAENANRAKSDFLATMSHELRTPLNAIAGHLQLLQMGIHGPTTEEQRAALTRIDRSQRHLLGLINDVLNLARIEAGRIEYSIESVLLEQAIADLAPMIEPQLAAKKLRFVPSIQDSSLGVRADPERLQQVLLNLLSNAIKFTAPNGTIGVQCELHPEADDRVLVRVSDTGIGIPPEKLETVFEPFVQVDSSHSRLGQGTGLGLSISRDLARGMGGELTVASRLGEGSTFTLVLPRDSSPAARGVNAPRAE